MDGIQKAKDYYTSKLGQTWTTNEVSNFIDEVYKYYPCVEGYKIRPTFFLVMYNSILNEQEAFEVPYYKDYDDACLHVVREFENLPWLASKSRIS